MAGWSKCFSIESWMSFDYRGKSLIKSQVYTRPVIKLPSQSRSKPRGNRLKILEDRKQSLQTDHNRLSKNHQKKSYKEKVDLSSQECQVFKRKLWIISAESF